MPGDRPSIDSRPNRSGACAVIVCVAVALALGGCREDAKSPEASAGQATKTHPNPLIFSEEHRADDETVNAFVTHAMTVCASGDYDDFRLLWSVREDPLPRQEFERGWQAVKSIRIRDLQRVIVAPSDPADDEAIDGASDAYAILANVQLDPDHPAGQRQPDRQVVLLIRREGDRWRLARAPKSVRTWILKRNSPNEAATTTAPRPDRD